MRVFIALPVSGNFVQSVVAGCTLLLAGAIEDALERNGLETGQPFRPCGKQPFTPHLTLARARHPGTGLTVHERTIPLMATCLVESVVVYRSETGPGGARYEVILALPLGGRARQGGEPHKGRQADHGVKEEAAGTQEAEHLVLAVRRCCQLEKKRREGILPV